MKGLIIAAGRGQRLGSFTDNVPKPLVDINGECFFSNTIKHFNNLGIHDIGAVVGYKKEQFSQFKHVTFFDNNNWKDNNILHSLFCARNFMNDDIIIAYGDIWFTERPIKNIQSTSGDFVIGVDEEWHHYYKGRTEHPVSEAENVHYDDNLNVQKIGKHVGEVLNDNHKNGEFMGLIKISKDVIKQVVGEFEELEAKLLFTDKFQKAQQFQKAYLTDFIQYLLSKSYSIKCSVSKQGWFEIDTVQDLQNLKLRMKNDKTLVK